MVCSHKNDSGDKPERLHKRDHYKRYQLNHMSECLVVFARCSVCLCICLFAFLYCTYVHVCNAP